MRVMMVMKTYSFFDHSSECHHTYMILMIMIQRMVMLKKHIRLVARMGAELLIYWTKMIAEQVSWVLWSVQKKNVEVANFYMLKCYMSSARWGKRAMCICGWIEWMRSDFCHKFSLNGMDKFFHWGGHWTMDRIKLQIKLKQWFIKDVAGLFKHLQRDMQVGDDW